MAPSENIIEPSQEMGKENEAGNQYLFGPNSLKVTKYCLNNTDLDLGVFFFFFF